MVHGMRRCTKTLTKKQSDWMYITFCGLCIIPKIGPWAMNLSGSSKRDRYIFKSCDISLENTPTSHLNPHSQSVYPYLGTHAVTLQYFFCHVLAYVTTANGVCLHLLVPPLAKCCFFGASCIAACSMA